MKTKLVLTGILKDHDKLLTVRRSLDDDLFAGAWEFPGGHIEEGETIKEGLAREFVRNVQNLRKEKDFVITDHINVYYYGDKEIDDMFKKYKKYIMGEVLGEKLKKKKKLSNEFELNGVKCLIDVERI